MNEKIKKYPKTEDFEVADTMGVPHPFCITEKHGMKGCNLMYEEHETAVAVKCKIKDDEKLKKYLLSIKDMVEQDGFAGFVLVDCFSKKQNSEVA